MIHTTTTSALLVLDALRRKRRRIKRKKLNALIQFKLNVTLLFLLMYYSRVLVLYSYLRFEKYTKLVEKKLLC